MGSKRVLCVKEETLPALVCVERTSLTVGNTFELVGDDKRKGDPRRSRHQILTH